MHKLAAHVNAIVVVRAQREGRVPDEAVARAIRRRAGHIQRPHFYRMRDVGAQIVSCDDAANAARARRARPHEIAVHRVRGGPSAFAAAHGAPHAARDAGIITGAAGARVARPHRARPVLSIAVDVVRDLVVDGDVVHLRDGELHLIPREAAIGADRDASVVADEHAAGIRGIDPDVVMIATGDLRRRRVDDMLAAVQGF